MPNALLPPSLQLSINPISPALPCIPNTKSTRQGFAAVTEVTASCNTRIPRRSVLSVAIGGSLLQILAVSQAEAVNSGTVPEFYNLEGGVKALDIREGKGRNPHIGDKVFIHYYGRIAAKQGWRFDSTYEHKDNSGDPQPFFFYVGSSSVISGLSTAVQTMRPGGVRRVIIPPAQGYQSTSQEPLPPNVYTQPTCSISNFS